MYICEFCSLVSNVLGGGASTHSHTIQVQGERANPWQKPPLSHTETNPASMELHSDSDSDTYRWTINRHCWNYLLIEHALYHYFSSISPSFTYTLHCVGIGFCLRPKQKIDQQLQHQCTMPNSGSPRQCGLPS